MVEITVGAASACIAAGIAVLQFIIPNALALVLTGTLSESHSAVTWSVVSRFLLTSDWPLILRSETASSTSVARKIAFITWIKPVALLVASIAAIVTPLGLHNGIYPSTSHQEVDFVYAADGGPLGSGTHARNTQLGFSRICRSIACPGERELGNITLPSTYDLSMQTNRIISPEIPQSLVDLFQSGIPEGSSISSFFDVQYRKWQEGHDHFIVDNSTVLQGAYKTLGSSMLDNKYEVLEGIILDTINVAVSDLNIVGSIGFRNHSVPTGLVYGAEWEEDLLFLEPVATCVNTNLSAYWTVSELGNSYSTKGLVDHGGFVDLNRTNPYPESEKTGGNYPFMDGQKNPMLYGRAYLAAWGASVYAMQYLNVTEPRTNRSRISSKLGQKFRVNSSFPSVGMDTSDLLYTSRTSLLASIVDPPYLVKYGSNDSTSPQIPNPWNVTSTMFLDLEKYCATRYGDDPVNITEIAVAVGMVLGVGHRVDKGFEDSTDTKAPNSTWEKPIYVCSGATQAKIKTVTFRYNSTIDNSLAGLYVAAIQDKVYDQKISPPVWGFETPKPEYNVSWINPIWGIVDPSKASTANLSTWHAPSFYIPHSSESVSQDDLSYENGDFVPLIRAPPTLWSTALMTSYNSDIPTYNGANDQRLQLAWDGLSRNTTGIEEMLRLIWTDAASNFLVGTKGHHTSEYHQPVPYSANSRRRSENSQPVEATFQVHVLEYHIRYHWIYAIPALICMCVVAAALFWALVSMICGQGTIARLRYYLYAITSGRVMAAFVYADTGGVEHRQIDTKTWIQEVGHKPVQIFEQPVRQGRTTEVGYGGQMNTRTKIVYMSVRQGEDGDAES